MPVTFNPKDRAVREISAKYETPAGTIEDIRVRYLLSDRCRDETQHPQTSTPGGSAGEKVWISDTLAPLIESLPDLVERERKAVRDHTGVSGVAFQITNLMAIDKAIREDLDPK
jgi:hypothetical protein